MWSSYSRVRVPSVTHECPHSSVGPEQGLPKSEVAGSSPAGGTIEELFNGRTADSGSADWGSIPCSSAKGVWYNRNNMSKNRTTKQHREAQNSYYYTLRAMYIERLGGFCRKCGSKERLEFDHVDPASKSFDVSLFASMARERVDEEMKKCQLLCFTCHNEKTQGEIESRRRHGTTCMYQRGNCRCGECRAANEEYRRSWRLRTGRTLSSRGPNKKTLRRSSTG